MSFADSFWSTDYQHGFRNLFTQLNQGVLENNDFIALFQSRMESELSYGNSLQRLSLDSKPTNTRFKNDDYVSSIKNCYLKMNENFNKQGLIHLQIGENIQLNVLSPFQKWCSDHEQRVSYSTSVIQDKYKQFKNHQLSVDKLQKRYFNKCRMLEEFKSHYSEEELDEELKDMSFSNSDKDEVEQDEIALQVENISFNHEDLKLLLKKMLENIPRSSHKVAILGTYHNVSTGSAITKFILEHIPQFNSNLDMAEKFGLELLKNDYIRIIGSMNKSFINSSQFYYQWKSKCFELSNLPEFIDSTQQNQDSSKFKNFLNLDDVKEAIGVTGIDYNDKSQFGKLLNDVQQLDSQYYKSVVELDKVRCEFEEMIMDHFTFMQKCEFDRLKAIKKVTFDFIASFHNDANSNNLKKINEELTLLEETINPINDLKFLIENYSTGKFKPQVVLYDNYYESNINQIFGVDLNVKSRLDKKVVPIIIQCILSHLDSVYPDLVNDEERINLWTKPIHLSNVHKLRSQLNNLNNDYTKINDVLQKNHPLVITNVLKLYLMELPDSIIPSNYYDLIKSLYTNYTDDTNSRINGLQNVLGELPKCNLASLDAILTHLNRLISIIGSKDDALSKRLKYNLSKEFSLLILNPKQNDINDTNHLKDKHSVNMMNDLFDNKENIFNELKRKSSKKPGVSRHNSVQKNSSHTLAAKSKSRLESRLQKAVTTEKPKDQEQTKTLDKTPSKSRSSSPTKLRSSSPTKKNLNSLLNEEPKSKQSPASYRPQKDIIYDTTSQHEFSPTPPPKFAPSLGRKSSVKDLASQFENNSKEDLTLSKSGSNKS